MVDDISHQTKVYFVVLVSNNISHSSHLFPGQIWMLLSKLGRKSFCRFSNDHKMKNDTSSIGFIKSEIFPAEALRKPSDGLARMVNISQ